MDKIKFINNSKPAINDTNLNLMQENIENAILGVVDSGSNENGKYIKFIDGTMICTKTVTFTNVAFPHSQGGLYFCTTLYFGSTPAEFVEVYSTNLNIIKGWALDAGLRDVSANSFGSTQFFRGANETQTELTVQVTAIGRWK